MPGIEQDEITISASDWLAVIKPLLDSGHLLKICPSGSSMTPFLAGGRDEVKLASVNRRLKRGDIVLFSRENGKHVLHRIHHIKKGQYFMLGDAQTWIEGPVDRQNIHAVAASVIRKGRVIPCAGFLSRLFAQLWLLLRPLRPIVFRAVLFIRRRVKQG